MTEASAAVLSAPGTPGEPAWDCLEVLEHTSLRASLALLDLGSYPLAQADGVRRGIYAEEHIPIRRNKYRFVPNFLPACRSDGGV